MRISSRWRVLLSFSILWCAAAFAQSTQSLISGRIVDSEQGTAIAGASVAYLSLATNTGGEVRADAAGYFVAPLLPPGKYRLRVTAGDHQAQELYELDLPVASSLEVNFRLRPLSDIWEQGQYRSVFLPGTKSVLPFYGPDVDTTHLALVDANRGHASPLETSVSTVVNPVEISELPLSGRDVYATLVLQPGVTADTTTARGLGYSVNGQRPSSSNYLLDGVENNNYLVTGPLVTVAPEAVQEYRLSTNAFSAEYGRSSGFVANAVTRSGGNRWHGIGYFEFENDALNANSFQNNLAGLPRTPLKQDQPGFQVGGPILRNTLFESLAVDYLRSRSFDAPVAITLPTTNFLNSETLTAPNGIALGLLRKYVPPPVTAANGDYSAIVNLSPPIDVDRLLGLERLDYVKGQQRLMARLAVSLLSRPNFIWSPYKDFDSALNDNTTGLALAWVRSLRPDLTNELRGGPSSDNLYWNRPHPEIPTLMSGDGALLPGSYAAYAFKNHSRNWEILDNVLWSRGRHIVKAGGGLLLRRLDGYLTYGRDGQYVFDSLNCFAVDSPSELFVGLDRQTYSHIPNFSRQYSYNQYFLFAQDSFKASPRLTLNYGVRYENSGSPQDTGLVKNAVVQLGPGTGFPQELTGAQVIYPTQGSRSLYGNDNRDWSVRVGFAYSLRRDSRTVLRGGYGIFYDRPFDNLWQNLANNNFVQADTSLNFNTFDYRASIASVVQGLSFPRIADFPRLTLYQNNIRSAYAQDYFLGVQQQISNNFTLEVDGAGSLGRRLITTDIVNRANSMASTSGYFNSALRDINYRGNQGASDYNALTVIGRYRARRAQFQVAYTWSHAIDNQSDPLLAGDYFNLSFTSSTASAGNALLSSFTRQFDSRSDRGNSDFDQRHNLVFYSIWELPAVFSGSRFAPVFRNWRLSQVGAIRSGFPFTVYGSSDTPQTSGGQFLPTNRADLIDPAHAIINTPAPGGTLILNSAAFANPPANTLGNTGRNEFRGPGLFSIDVSLSRAFAVARLGEAGRVIVRADAYNPLNHVNLNNPDITFLSTVPDSGFGVAKYGRMDRTSGFPAVIPLSETARQIQLMLRLEF